MVTKIPYDEIEISDGWRLSALTTLEDCDEASLQLSRDIASITAQLEEFDRDSGLGATVTDEEADWRRSAQSALTIKRQIRQLVQNRRSDIGRQGRAAAAKGHDKRLLALLQATAPDAFAAAVNLMKEDV